MVDRPRIGTEFAGYRIEGTAGRGGASTVYQATNLKLGNRVALKVLSPELGEGDVFRERFVRESQIAAQINHPNIIPIYDAGAAGDYLYIAMRYVDGADLKAQIAEHGALPAERTMRIVRQVGRALDVAHARGLVHRDVKPANVLLEEVGTEHEHAYLADFGLTKRTGSHTGLTGSDHFIGTIDYMAPEQIEGSDVDGRADVYALACMVYQCMTGVVPFPKDAELAVLWAHMNEQPPAVSPLRPDLPVGLDAVIARGMSKSRDERYPTCEALVAALNETLGLAGASTSSSVIAPAPPASAAAPPPGQPAGEPPIVPAPPPSAPAPSETVVTPVGTGIGNAAPTSPQAPAGGSGSPPPPKRDAGTPPPAGAPGSGRRGGGSGRRVAVVLAGVLVILVAAGAAFAALHGGSSAKSEQAVRLHGDVGGAVTAMLRNHVQSCSQRGDTTTCGPASFRLGTRQFDVKKATFQGFTIADVNNRFTRDYTDAQSVDSRLNTPYQGICENRPAQWENEDDWFHAVMVGGVEKEEIQDGQRYKEEAFQDPTMAATNSGRVMCYQANGNWIIEWTQGIPMTSGGAAWFIGKIVADSQKHAYDAWFETHHMVGMNGAPM
jgi:serine/threonine protein kinase